MNKKRIVALDFDDVIIDTMLPFLKYYEEEYGVAVGPEHAYVPNSPAWQVGFPDVVARAELFHNTVQLQNSTFVQGAVDAVQQLARSCELHIITGRPDSTAEATRQIIETYFPGIFTSVNFTGVFATTTVTKSSVCHKLGVTFFVDDHIQHAIDVANSGIETLLFGDYPWNQASELPANIRRVNGWDEVLKIVKETK